MRIALVVDRDSVDAPSALAAEVLLRDAAGLAAALRGEGHEVDVASALAPPVADAALGRGVRLWPGADAPGSPGSPDDAVPRAKALGAWLRDLWREARPSVVLATTWWAGAAALVAGGRDRPPVLVRATPPDGATGSSLQRAVLAGADVVLATSETEQSGIVFRGGVPRRRTAVVPLGVDVHAFAEAPPRTGEGPVRVLTSGSADPATGVPALVRAMRAVPDAELLVAGVAPWPDDHPSVAALERLARQAGVHGRVRGVGHVPHADVPELLREVDVVAQVPPHGVGGRLALEALATARPVVVTATGALGDLVAHRTCGVAVPPGDEHALVGALRWLVRDPFARQALGQAGRDRVLARYSWDRVAADVLRLARPFAGEPATGEVVRAAVGDA